jgi:lysine 6-dehydrogenase
MDGGAMGYKYVVLGAGRQGVAAAYDLLRYGQAQSVVVADREAELARRAADRVNGLLQSGVAESAVVDVTVENALVRLLRGVDAVVSAVPYRFNLGVAQAAIEAGASMCDLGGNTDLVWQEMALDQEAKAAGVSIIPDCGLMPGMGNTLAVFAMGLMAQPQHVRIFVGGLPRHPRPPFDYLLTFHVAGLSNEYAGNAVYLRNGEIVEVPVFTELEMLDFPEPIGPCEAFVTSGGTSTCPWTFRSTLLTYEEKTVRYPGHCVTFKAFADLGLLNPTPIEVGDAPVIPRDVFHALLAPKISFPQDEDLVVLRVLCSGEDAAGRRVEAKIEVIDYQDRQTGFRAMERMTGFPAAIVAHMMAAGRTPRGVVPLELSVDGRAFVAEWRRRDLSLTEKLA